MSTSSLLANPSLAAQLAESALQPGGMPASPEQALFKEGQNGRMERDPALPGCDRNMPRASHPAVEIWPPHLVERGAVTHHGLTAEIVRAKALAKLEFRFRPPVDLLVVCAQGARRA